MNAIEIDMTEDMTGIISLDIIVTGQKLSQSWQRCPWEEMFETGSSKGLVRTFRWRELSGSSPRFQACYNRC